MAEKPGPKRRAASKSPNELLSRKLSKLLRHGVHENKLTDCLRGDGYLPLDRVLSCISRNGPSFTEEQVRDVVRNCSKQRFSIINDNSIVYIRANQGHTIHGLHDDAMLQPLDLSNLMHLREAVHGTYRRSWPGILASSGLKRMSRNHIHLAADLPGKSGVISGMRRSAELFVWVDLVSAHHGGVQFYRSSNGVILTPGLNEEGVLPVTYFSRVTTKDGEEVEIPGEGRGFPKSTRRY